MSCYNNKIKQNQHKVLIKKCLLSNESSFPKCVLNVLETPARGMEFKFASGAIDIRLNPTKKNTINWRLSKS